MTPLVRFYFTLTLSSGRDVFFNKEPPSPSTSYYKSTRCQLTSDPVRRHHFALNSTTVDLSSLTDSHVATALCVLGSALWRDWSSFLGSPRAVTRPRAHRGADREGTDPGCWPRSGPEALWRQQRVKQAVGRLRSTDKAHLYTPTITTHTK